MPTEKAIILEVEQYYTSRIREHGPSAKGVDWNSEETQIIRFKQLVKVIKNNGDFSILDYGCGYGALLSFMKSFYLEFDYTGFDVSSEMLAHASEIFESNSSIKWKDKLQGENFDYTIASGIFNVKQHQATDIWQSYVTGILQDLNTKSKNGFAFNMLTSYSDPTYRKDYLYYADPCFYFDFCKRNFSKNVALLHDYDLYEFSILVTK